MPEKPDIGMPAPRYSIWQAVNVAVSLGMRALEEVRALARDGGKPGPAGLGFDDFDIEYDGERAFIFRLARADQPPKEWSFSIKSQIYRGVYREGQYQFGDTVTWSGSLWHCNEPTTEKPGQGSKAWTLAVKCGRDGRDGKPGEKGERGADGRPGRDLTQMDYSGKKW